MAPFNVKTPTPQPRFGGDVLWLVFIFLSGLVGGTTMLLLHVGHYFDSTAPGVTTTVTGADGTTTSTVTTESLFLLNPARFAIVMLIGFGLILVVGGVVLALADLTKTPETVEAVVTSGGEAIGVSGFADPETIGAAIKGVLEGLASVLGALKDAKPPMVAMALGAGFTLFGGALAWQTIPDQSPAPTPVTTSTVAGAETSVPETSTDTATTTTGPSSSTEPSDGTPSTGESG